MTNSLRRIDLNLLLTLHALLAEKHISRAALRLHRSQPAVSHALAHLRDIFDDPLLVRRSGRLEPTARARELEQPLTDALNQLAALLDPPAFEPMRTERTLRLAMSDYGARVVLPGLIREVRAKAPGIDLVVTQASREAMATGVIDGEIDLAFGVFPSPLQELCRQTLFSECFACLADAASLPQAGLLDLEAWLARPHALVAARAGADSEIDRTLAELGLQRRISIVLPHWGVANDVIAGTDLILTVARRSLATVGQDSRLRVFEPPFSIEAFEFQQIWHPRRDIDPAHRWLRQTAARITTSG
ncbi:LysR substrate-binding domain-containing protein [Aquabacterium sp. A7-Y]|uniref:LysR substrate-binding domain-containing protein n=1 Tax=Aquabacterium sp. A7-Y TaxID=1349605 RepID=UPI00223DF43A|nr:LysR substrate-binding domain-containing protein [Aquabacterium sp. A7-Y]MCW7539483.1 LysR substrate-binding domain-containing protein [Aquabacterium sp. A7-Y]